MMNVVRGRVNAGRRSSRGLRPWMSGICNWLGTCRVDSRLFGFSLSKALGQTSGQSAQSRKD